MTTKRAAASYIILLAVSLVTSIVLKKISAKIPALNLLLTGRKSKSKSKYALMNKIPVPHGTGIFYYIVYTNK